MSCCCSDKEEKEKHSCCSSHSHKNASCCTSHSHEDDDAPSCKCNSQTNLPSHQGTKLIVSATSILLSFFVAHRLPFDPFTDPAWVAIFFCAIPIFREAFSTLIKRGRIGSPLLVSVAMMAAFTLQIFAFFSGDFSLNHEHSYIFVVAEISFLMSLGEWLEERTIKKARNGIESLQNLMPKVALKKSGNDLVEVSIEDIKVGDIICIRPNDMIAADGTVILGNTSVDESNMTGESMPIDKGIGSYVLGGTFNKSKYIEIEVTKNSNETSIAKLIKLVEEAEGKKAPISRIANRWASYIVPVAIATSILVFLLARFFLSTSTAEAVIRGVTILVVFCPCAFVLATPTAIAASLGNAAKNGILIKSGEALERLAKITSVFFDKTGTLTEGKIQVKRILPISCSENELLCYAACAEKFSEHPIAKAILNFAKDKVEITSPEKVESLIGFGVQAKYDNKTISVCKCEKDDSALTFESFKNGETIVQIEVNSVLMGYISLFDTIRASAKKSITTLYKNGYECAIISGDNQKAVRSIADMIGITDVYAQLSPQDKQALVEKTQKQEKLVCMIGDGVNDTPALAEAYASIAMADSRSDIAIDTASISLLGAELSKIPQVLSLSKRTMFTIKFNIVLSLIVSFSAIILSLYGIVTPVSGALIHNASSVMVVLNSARLLKYKRS